MHISSTIIHQGFVSRCERDRAYVRVVDAEACDSCQIRDYCGKSTSEDLFVVTRNNLKEGDVVQLGLSRAKGFSAVWWAYIAPFLLLTLVILLGTFYQLPESTIGGLAIGSLIPYFLILYMLRDKLKSKFTLHVTKS